jgi:hypothetical protein
MSKTLDITRNPWLSPSLQYNTLNRILAKIELGEIDELAAKIKSHMDSSAKLRHIQFVGQDTQAANYVAKTIFDLTRKKIALEITLDLNATPAFNGITIETLSEKSIHQLGNDIPANFLLVATYRAIVLGQSGMFPGLKCNISPTGIHAMLAQFGVKAD